MEQQWRKMQTGRHLDCECFVDMGIIVILVLCTVTEISNFEFRGVIFLGFGNTDPALL